MRHFTRDDWYFDGYTWCGVDGNGVVWYPFSYGDNGRAWRMTQNINDCLNHGTKVRSRRQIQAELKNDPVFFRHRYKKIFLVHIKEYPTFYFDYLTVARKHRIKLNHSMSQEEMVSKLKKYGFTPISDNPKIIEIGREEISYDEFAKKYSQQALSKYRDEVGSISRKDRNIKITDREWEAIQAGAIHESTLNKILNNAGIIKE